MGLVDICCLVEWSNGTLDFDLIGKTDEDKLNLSVWINASNGRLGEQAVSQELHPVHDPEFLEKKRSERFQKEHIL